ncbi:peptidase inhibitor family I36 protein [Kitasatospora sp. NPDC008115]|uniref:peptidase inhibitor family I36 protein n=1 Tax=Kitasatospora sp. NPDC008115 TaxID=3364022 RepID=UPI0036EF1EB2
MRSFRMLAVVTATAGALVLAAPAATAAPAPTVPSADAQQSIGPAEATSSKPVIAFYRGQRIDLSKGWGGAGVCTEVTGGDVYCHDSVAEADAAIAVIDPALAEAAKAAPAVPAGAGLSLQEPVKCEAGQACLWEHANATGDVLRWTQPGTKYLSDYGFRDKASAACVFRSSGNLAIYDDRTLQPDPLVVLSPNGYCYDLSTFGYPYGGNWNDKADYVNL